MSQIVRIKALDGTLVEFEDEVRASGGMKDVYFAPDRRTVVAFFRDKADQATRERLEMITGPYREKIFSQEGGEYLRNLFRWPTSMVEWNGKLGMVIPFYDSHYFFEHGSKNSDMLGIKGKEKDGKWFASASNRARFLDSRELGDWRTHLQVCLMVARAVRRMHAAGLAHSDLSYKNVLIDPTSGRACLIDIDGLVVPGKFPPEVVGTPDFIAPEVVATAMLDRADPARKLPSRSTDQHALAVLVYMYLFYRHPLRGDKIHDPDPVRDEELSMGSNALWVENPTDTSNRIDPAKARTVELPWKDTNRIPYTISGPYLSALFSRAFVQGLSDPTARPTADEWENALVRTMDLLQPCRNPSCEQKWFVFDNTVEPRCPFCGTPFHGKLPVLNLYSASVEGSFRPDDQRVMVYSGQSLFPWHANRNLVPNEKLRPEFKKRVGYFVFHEDVWYLVNEGLPDMMDAKNKTPVPVGGRVELVDGGQILLSRENGGRLVVVQLVQA
ncbi:MAG TPA: serine/threonine-protein kinase [Fibrobacteria bacterium]|nr:serine/threonine-protein kinase [Fibrobacteria bacterium]HOX52546.1 serine/threonine-protein kinase [Fibrobacteria bacterium]